LDSNSDETRRDETTARVGAWATDEDSKLKEGCSKESQWQELEAYTALVSGQTKRTVFR
jgi:hypothetical protein